MLDVHMIVSPLTPSEWVAKARSSVLEAISSAPFTVEFHKVSAFHGHIGRARKAGFAHGRHPYVTFVDEDDWIEPAFFEAIQRSLAGLDALFLPEMIERPKGQPIRRERHCRAVYRREMLDEFDFESWPVYSEIALRFHVEAKTAKIADLPQALYHWRYDPRSPAKQLAEHYPGLTATIRERIRG